MGSLEQTMSEMKYPWMHDEMRRDVEALADEDYQCRVWIDGERSSPLILFDTVVDFFLNDTDLSTKSEAAIGWFLRNQSEADAGREVVRALNVVLDDEEAPSCDAEYFSTAH
jgi:hypothetical protein